MGTCFKISLNSMAKINKDLEDKINKCLFSNPDKNILCDKYHIKIEKIPTDDYKSKVLVFHNNNGDSKIDSFLIYPYEVYDCPLNWCFDIKDDETFLTRMNMMIDEISVFLPEIKQLEFNDIKKRMFAIEE